ncbi:MAG: redox-active disulfide protein 2 [Spirosomataceae bacterium]
MKENSFEKMTTEELKKGIKTNNLVSGLLGGMLLVLICLNIFNIINGNSGFTSLTIPVALLPILLLPINNLNKMKSELKKREAIDMNR